METIFMNLEKSKMSEPPKFVLKLVTKIRLKRIR